MGNIYEQYNISIISLIQINNEKKKKTTSKQTKHTISELSSEFYTYLTLKYLWQEQIHTTYWYYTLSLSILEQREEPQLLFPSINCFCSHLLYRSINSKLAALPSLLIEFSQFPLEEHLCLTLAVFHMTNFTWACLGFQSMHP